MSKNLVENEEFRKFVKLLNPCAPQPCRKLLDKEINLLWSETKQRMKLVLSRMKQIALTIGKRFSPNTLFMQYVVCGDFAGRIV